MSRNSNQTGNSLENLTEAERLALAEKEKAEALEAERKEDERKAQEKAEAERKAAEQAKVVVVAKAKRSDAANDELYGRALANEEGYTLIPVSKVAGNKTVEAVDPAIVRNGMAVVKLLAK